jgi:Ca2+-dependent lipid-binding protein
LKNLFIFKFKRHLINTDKNSLSDPYARIYLLPDEKKVTKKSTKVIKDELNPAWEETFYYTMTYAEAITKTLHVNVKDEKGFFEKQDTQFLGEVILCLLITVIDLVSILSL